jgi:hypothetical protein
VKSNMLKQSKNQDCKQQQYYRDFITEHGAGMHEIEVCDVDWLRDEGKSPGAKGPLTTLIRSATLDDLPKVLALLASTIKCDYSNVEGVGYAMALPVLQGMVEQNADFTPESYVSALVGEHQSLQNRKETVLASVWAGYACYMHAWVVDLADESAPKLQQLSPIELEIPPAAKAMLGVVHSEKPAYLLKCVRGQIDLRDPDVVQLQQIIDACSDNFDSQTPPPALPARFIPDAEMTVERAQNPKTKRMNLQKFLETRGWVGESSTKKSDLVDLVLQELKNDEFFKQRDPNYQPPLRNPSGLSSADEAVASGKVVVTPNTQNDPQFKPPNDLDPKWTSLPLLESGKKIEQDI